VASASLGQVAQLDADEQPDRAASGDEEQHDRERGLTEELRLGVDPHDERGPDHQGRDDD
jgi:hypothetical protein